MEPTDLRPAKFRGIECAARDLGLKAGRRKVRDTVPGRDGEVSEDLGRAAREYSIQFVCTGEDWKDTYNALIDAVEDPTPAEFQHPDGTITQVTPDGTFDFSIVSVGEATVSATLIEETDANRVEAEDDAAAATVEAADENDLISADRLAEIFAAGAAAEQSVNDVADGIQDVINKGKKIAAQITLKINQIKGNISQIIQGPANVAQYFTDLYQSISDWSVLSTALGRYHTTEIERTADYASVTDPDAQGVVRNTHELNLHCMNCIVSQMSRIANEVPYTSFDDAQTAVNAVAAYIDSTAPYLNARQLAAIGDLQAQLVTSVLATSQQMPRLKDFTPWTVMSADEIAQYLYQDGTRAAEIVARNNIQHPGFIGPDQTLKVLEV